MAAQNGGSPLGGEGFSGSVILKATPSQQPSSSANSQTLAGEPDQEPLPTQQILPSGNQISGFWMGL